MSDQSASRAFIPIRDEAEFEGCDRSGHCSREGFHSRDVIDAMEEGGGGSGWTWAGDEDDGEDGRMKMER